MSKQIVVTGATGFLGSRIVEKLVEIKAYDRIIAAGRSLKPEYEIQSALVEYRLGDLGDLGYCRALVEGSVHIVNCASLSSPWGSAEAFYQANVVTQKNLIRAAQEADVQRYVYISTPSIYFAFYDRFEIRESDPLPNPLVNAYAKTKLEAEKMLEQSGLSYISLRPRALVGRGDSVVMPRMIRAYREGRLRIIGDGENRAELTAVSNVVQAVQLSLEAPEEHCGESYSVTNGEAVKLWQAINYTLEKMGLEPVQQKVPYWLAYQIAGLMEWISTTFQGGKEPALVRYSVGILAQNMTINIDKIKERLGYEPQQSTYEAIDEFVEWYQRTYPNA